MCIKERTNNKSQYENKNPAESKRQDFFLKKE